MPNSPTSPRKLAAALLVVVVATLLPRTLDLNRFVTPDERFWLRRSANFYFALTDGRFAQTLQAFHPGVPTTWAGALAFWLCCRNHQDEIQRAIQIYSPADVTTREVPLELALVEYGYDPLEMLAKARLIVALTVTILLGISFLAVTRLLGMLPALLGCLLVALDPFHLALSRLLHVDALMTGFVFLSLLLILNYLFSGNSRWYLVGSAVAAGLAWLTKTPALILLPFVGVLWLSALWREWKSDDGLNPSALWNVTRPYALWAVVGAATFVLLWPAMWVKPVEIIWSFATDTGKAVLLGHARGTFFAGEALAKRGHPGVLFYPVNYFWRTSPMVLLGLVAFLIALATRRAPWRLLNERKSALTLLLFAGVFLAAMTIGSKQMDRYLLPIFPPLDLVAAMGWVLTLRSLGSRVPAAARMAVPGVVAALVALQGALAFRTAPYYLTYYNPLLGGPRRAAEVVLIGWGEGLDQAARYLNGKPNAENMRVMSWYGDGPFSYFFDGQAIHYDDSVLTEILRVWRDPESTEVGNEPPDFPDYLVLYINQWQRDLAPKEILSRQPEHVVRLAGVEYARIYDLRQLSLP